MTKYDKGWMVCQLWREDLRQQSSQFKRSINSDSCSAGYFNFNFLRNPSKLTRKHWILLDKDNISYYFQSFIKPSKRSRRRSIRL